MWPKSQSVSVACHWSFLCCYSTGGYRQDDLDIMRLCYSAWSIDVIEEVEEVCTSTSVLSLILFSMCLIKALSSLPYLAKKNGIVCSLFLLADMLCMEEQVSLYACLYF